MNRKLPADEAAARAIHDLRMLLDEVFYADLQQQLASAQNEVQRVVARVKRVDEAVQDLVSAQSEIREGVIELQGALAQRVESLHARLAQLGESVTDTLRSEVRAVDSSVDEIAKLMESSDRMTQGHWARAEEIAGRSEQATAVLSEAVAHLKCEFEARLERVESELLSLSGVQQVVANRAATQLEYLEAGLLPVPEQLERLRAGAAEQMVSISTARGEFQELISSLGQTLVAAIERGSQAEGERSTALATQWERSSTALTMVTEARISILNHRVLGIAALTLLGWLLPAVMLWRLWRLGN